MDIHLHVEYKVDYEEEEWVADLSHVKALHDTAPNTYLHGGFDMGRNTSFFRFMIKTLSHGLPPDLSYTIKKIHGENDKIGVFGECHCSLHNYKKCIAEYNLQLLAEGGEDQCFIFESGNDVSSLIKVIKHIEKEARLMDAKDVRLIFWFDV